MIFFFFFLFFCWRFSLLADAACAATLFTLISRIRPYVTDAATRLHFAADTFMLFSPLRHAAHTATMILF